ncbi:hypothetical protein [Providencia vermicola]|uniref:hypothetical protein n=1 Tax=Providencia vermicola TaxID=333965 RepID=UPI001CED880A|nr:hypothetical protein [Providencia vermicola]
MKVNQNIVSHQPAINYINSHKNQSNMAQVIGTIKNLSNHLPKIEDNSKVTTKTVVTKDLKILSKQIDSVIKDAKDFLDKANDSNASRRPDQNESRNMQEGLDRLKAQIINYKTNAFSISSYKHNASKSTTLDKLTKKIENMETEVIKSNIKNNQLTKQPEVEKNQRMQESNERAIKRTDYSNTLNNR